MVRSACRLPPAACRLPPAACRPPPASPPSPPQMIDPNALAPHYSRFRVAERLLMTGHSHQAWPDVAREAQIAAFDAAARDVDAKWGPAYERADRVRAGWRRLLGDDDRGEIALAPNTHELFARLLSAVDWRARGTLLTTDAEFHTVRRQVDRLAEAGWIRVRKVEGRPVEGAVERMIDAIDDDVAVAVISSVYFATSEVVPHIAELARACAAHGIALVVDSYHHLGALPFSLPDLGLEGAYVMGGGDKYVQLGGGNCFLRFPADSDARPVFTGWFAEFAELAAPKTPGEVPYGIGPARFMGATYDPVSHYRAAAVFDFFERESLTIDRLRELSQHQIRRLATGLARHLGGGDPVGHPSLPGLRRGWANVGGFLALKTTRAAELHEALKDDGVPTDYRGELLRFGPAPYVTDAQIDAVIERVGAAIRRVGV